MLSYEYEGDLDVGSLISTFVKCDTIINDEKMFRCPLIKHLKFQLIICCLDTFVSFSFNTTTKRSTFNPIYFQWKPSSLK